MVRKLIALALAGAMLLPLGCATYPETYELPVKPASSYTMSQTQGGLTVAVEPIADKSLQQKLFGVELSSMNTLPVFVVAEDHDPEAGFLLENTDISLERKGQAPASQGEADPTVPNRSLPAGHKATVAVWYSLIYISIFAPVALIPGVAVGSVALNEERKAEFTNQMLIEGAFQSRTLFPGESHKGFVYFQLKDEASLSQVSALSLKAKNMATGEEATFTFDIAKSIERTRP